MRLSSYLLVPLLWLILPGNGKNLSVPKQKYKIALVKQVVYQDLYCAPSSASKKEIVFSTFKRTGPAGLFSYCNADFYIVDVEPDPECSVWKEKAFRQLGIPAYESLKDSIPGWGVVAGHTVPQGTFSVSCDSISWDDYDIVISFDIAVPTRIVRAHPRILWCYYIGEPCQPSFSRSLQKTLAEYDCFLTQDFHKEPRAGNHLIEFPYHAQYYGCFHDLLDLDISVTNQKGVFCYGAVTAQEEVALQSVADFVRYNDRVSSKTLITTLLQSKYALFCGKNYCRGNALAEAVAAGCLVIGNPAYFSNRDLFSSRTTGKSFKELLENIAYFEQHPDVFQTELKKQRELCDYYCFVRPVQELFKRLERKRSKA